MDVKQLLSGIKVFINREINKTHQVLNTQLKSIEAKYYPLYEMITVAGGKRGLEFVFNMDSYGTILNCDMSSIGETKSFSIDKSTWNEILKKVNASSYAIRNGSLIPIAVRYNNGFIVSGYHISNNIYNKCRLINRQYGYYYNENDGILTVRLGKYNIISIDSTTGDITIE